SDREREADLVFLPSQVCKIESQEGAKADLHVGDEEVGPVKAAAALIGDLPVEHPPALTMLRDRATRPRWDLSEGVLDPGVATGRCGPRLSLDVGLRSHQLLYAHFRRASFGTARPIDPRSSTDLARH